MEYVKLINLIYMDKLGYIKNILVEVGESKLKMFSTMTSM